MSKEKQIEEMIEYLNNTINVERNSYFGKGCMRLPLIEADKILDILKGYRKQSEGEWIKDNNKRTCSLCGYLYYSNNDNFNYCPNCGAKMKGGAE